MSKLDVNPELFIDYVDADNNLEFFEIVLEQIGQEPTLGNAEILMELNRGKYPYVRYEKISKYCSDTNAGFDFYMNLRREVTDKYFELVKNTELVFPNPDSFIREQENLDFDFIEEQGDNDA